MKRRALFLDRDGVINIDHGYVHRPEEFVFVPGILELMRDAQERGYLPIIVTNQSGIGRGYYTREQFEALTAWMLTKMRAAGIGIGRSQVFACPHAPEEGCRCRKPEPGMILEAAERFDLDLPNSWMIGDKVSDMQAACRAGVGHALLIRPNRTIERKDLHGF
jgi:D-glycero-D-manno-heptose 1,7-bisphosphate phosphatase